jgi:YgiT-type zinc finger domain-containing protein
MTMALPPASDYGQCPCGGTYERKLVEVRMTVNGQAILVEDVAQGYCPTCGSRVYKAVVIEELEALMSGQPAPGPRALL